MKKVKKKPKKRKMKYVATMDSGDRMAVLPNGTVIIVNANRPPRFIDNWHFKEDK